MRGQRLRDAGQHHPAGPGQAAPIVTACDRAPPTDHPDRPRDLLGNRGHPVADDSLYRNRRRAKASDHRAGRVARQHHLGGPHLGERRDDRGEPGGQLVGPHPAVGSDPGVRPVQQRQSGRQLVQGAHEADPSDAPVDNAKA